MNIQPAKGGIANDEGYMPKESRSHNTILINGTGQLGNSSGRMIDYKELGDAVYAKAQAPEAYEWPGALPGHFQRQLLFGRADQPYLLIVDDVQCETDTETDYTWLLHTNKKNKISVLKDKNKAVITGKNHGSVCDVIFLSGDVKVYENDLTGRLSTAGEDIATTRSFIRNSGQILMQNGQQNTQNYQ